MIGWRAEVSRDLSNGKKDQLNSSHATINTSAVPAARVSRRPLPTASFPSLASPSLTVPLKSIYSSYFTIRSIH